MANRFDFGGVNMRAEDDPHDARPASETPFCIAVLGDFSARGSRGIFEPKTVGERRALLIDRDNFDRVMSRLKAELHLARVNTDPLVIRFSELDDFHPDRLFEHAAFQEFKSLRKRLEDPATFSQVAAEFGLRQPQDLVGTETVERSARVAAPSPLRLASGSLLDEMVEQTEARIALAPPRASGSISEFAHQLAAKYAVSAPDPRQPDVISAFDRAISHAMRAVLHHPDFQALESIWRAMFLLVRQVETGPQLKIYLIDVSKPELAADLGGLESLRESGICRLLVEKASETPGADPWTIVVGGYSFGTEDTGFLSKLAKVVQQGGAIWLGGADPSLLGCNSLAVTPNPREWNKQKDQHSWNQLRSLPEAACVGLALPRFLLRLPYGKQTSPLEAFDFEEFADKPSHEEYLWGNPGFALAQLLSQSFTESGWSMRPGSASQMDNLPLHTYRLNGEPESKPCAEVLLTEEAVERILDLGLIPLISYKGRDSVRVGRFQSIAEPQQPLRG
ncbi:MAG TPA: type VI secretion system contractile sheath large subunit, partial [Dongiaceae bacterium]|nr:type VI secretion system contractile sheath large subunit [Dongiaceae bacterium]